MKKTTDKPSDWTVVANASRARIVRLDHAGRLEVLAAFDHPDARLKSSQLGSDRAGREQGPARAGGAAFAPRLDEHRKAHLEFARRLAEALEMHAKQGDFDRLHLFASSPFLGELKTRLQPASARRLQACFPLDLTALEGGQLAARIQQELAGAASAA